MENRKHHTRDESHHDLNRLFSYDVLDNNGNSIGKVDNIWVDETGQPAFFGVQTGWLFGKLHVVPAHQAQVNYERRRIRLPHSEDKVKDAPTFDTSADLSPEQESEIYRYYGLQSAQPEAPTEHRETAEPAEARSHEMEDERTVQLNEERAEIGKRDVGTGGVRLRKVIRTETVHEPVELQHEDIEIERIPAEEGKTTASNLGDEEEIYIPLRQEEAVVHKETHPKEQVRVGKKVETERKDVSEDVRKEDIEIERENRKKYGT